MDEANKVCTPYIRYGTAPGFPENELVEFLGVHGPGFPENELAEFLGVHGSGG